jgi:hypothetical protein
MIPQLGDISLGKVSVRASNYSDSVDVIVEHALDEIIQVSMGAPQPIRDQALAYKETIRSTLQYYITDAIRKSRLNLSHKLRAASMDEAAKIVEP